MTGTDGEIVYQRDLSLRDFATPATWVFVREVQERTGVYGDAQRFDGVAIGLVPSVKYARVIYEVKVSRADWLRELKPRVEFTSHGQRLSVHMARNFETYKNEPWMGGMERRDFLKWESGLALSNEFYFAAPPRCILPSEVPEGTGLIEVRPWGSERQMRARIVVKAPWRDTPHPGPEFWAAVVRRAATHKAAA